MNQWILSLNGTTSRFLGNSDQNPTGMFAQDQNGVWRRIADAVQLPEDNTEYFDPRALRAAEPLENQPGTPIQYP